MLRIIGLVGLNAAFLWVLSYLFSGITIDSFVTYIVAAAVLCVINVTLKPILQALMLPISVLTLGFFALIINGLMLLLVAKIVPGVYIDGLDTAFWAALIYTVLNVVFSSMEKSNS